MSTRRNAANNRIRGPQSALTDFLASNNISAAQIRADYEARQRAAGPADDSGDGSNQSREHTSALEGAEHEDDDENEEATTETPAQQRKRKRQEKAAMEKIKKSKAFKKRKAGLADEPGGDDEDGLAFDLYEKSRPPPGQLSNCDLCSKRFTVTPYSREGPNGGLLCHKCSKEAKDDEKKAKKQKKVPTKRGNRRQHMSDLLDGKVRDGSKTLLDVCLEKVADVSNDVDDFGEIPDNLLDRLSMIFSKRRVMTTRTSHLFLRPSRDKIVIYDASRLETPDFEQIFAIVPKLRHLKLTYAGQMKDTTIDYMIDRNVQLETLQLEAPNLISDKKWQELFTFSGHSLKNFKIDSMDASFTDETVEVLVNQCPNLRRVKIRDCRKLTEAAVQSLARIKHLEHLSLRFESDISGDTLVDLLTSAGAHLETLCLENFPSAGNSVLEAIHQTCTKLRKFRFCGNDYATDAAFTDLFTSWSNIPLKLIDFNSCRDITEQESDEVEDPVGFGSDGLRAMMEHSGSMLEILRIASCRHVSHETLSSVFDGSRTYPCLKEIDMSLLPEVDDFIMASIFKSCPALKKIVVFACFGVRDVKIPPGVALIGTPKAQDVIVQGDALAM